MWTVPSIVLDYAAETAYVGSKALLGHGRDVDFAAHIPGDSNRYHVAGILLGTQGYTLDGSEHIGPGAEDFVSVSKMIDGVKYNILICGAGSWRRYTEGHTACKALMQMGVAMDVKSLRVFIHQIVAGASPKHALSEADKYVGL